MTTPLTIPLDFRSVFDVGALLIPLCIMVVLAVAVSFTVDPTQEKLDKTNIKLDQIMELDNHFNQKLDTILSILNNM